MDTDVAPLRCRRTGHWRFLRIWPHARRGHGTRLLAGRSSSVSDGHSNRRSCRHPQRRVVGPEGDTQEEQVTRIIYRDEDRIGAFLVRHLFHRCVYFLHTGHGKFFPVAVLLKCEEFDLHKVCSFAIIVMAFLNKYDEEKNEARCTYQCR